MKIPFFEILVLIFLLWPLIQRFLGKQKDPEQQDDFLESDEIDYNLPPPIDDREPPKNWQEAMQELEMIFTGQVPESKVPPAEPVQAPAPSPATITRNADFKRSSEKLRTTRSLSESSVYTTSSKHKSREFKSDELVDELMMSDNAIYQSLDKEVTIEDGMNLPSYSVFSDVRNPERLREFFVIKEILDKPVSRRHTRNFV
jgi:hypothetical protein